MKFGLGNGLPELGLRCHIQTITQSLFQNTQGEPVGLPMVAATRLLRTFAVKLKVAFCGTLMKFGLGNGLPELGLQCHIQKNAKSLFQKNSGRACGTANGGSNKTVAYFCGQIESCILWDPDEIWAWEWSP